MLTDAEVTCFESYEAFTGEVCIQEAINFSNSIEFFAVVLNNKVIGKIYFSAARISCIIIYHKVIS